MAAVPQWNQLRSFDVPVTECPSLQQTVSFTVHQSMETLKMGSVLYGSVIFLNPSPAERGAMRCDTGPAKVHRLLK